MDWFTIQYGGVEKANIDITGKMSLYSVTGNDWKIGNATFALSIASNYAKKWDIGVSNDNLRFNPDYQDVVTFDRNGNISSRGLNVSNYNGVVCAGSSEYGFIQNIGTGTSGQILTSNGSGNLPSWSNAPSTNPLRSGFQVIMSW